MANFLPTELTDFTPDYRAVSRDPYLSVPKYSPAAQPTFEPTDGCAAPFSCNLDVFQRPPCNVPLGPVSDLIPMSVTGPVPLQDVGFVGSLPPMGSNGSCLSEPCLQQDMAQFEGLSQGSLGNCVGNIQAEAQSMQVMQPTIENIRPTIPVLQNEFSYMPAVQSMQANMAGIQVCCQNSFVQYEPSQTLNLIQPPSHTFRSVKASSGMTSNLTPRYFPDQAGNLSAINVNSGGAVGGSPGFFKGNIAPQHGVLGALNTSSGGPAHAGFQPHSSPSSFFAGASSNVATPPGAFNFNVPDRSRATLDNSRAFNFNGVAPACEDTSCGDVTSPIDVSSPPVRCKRKAFEWMGDGGPAVKIHVNEERMASCMTDLHLDNNNLDWHPDLEEQPWFSQQVQLIRTRGYADDSAKINRTRATALRRFEVNENSTLEFCHGLEMGLKTKEILPKVIREELNKSNMQIMLWRPPGESLSKMLSGVPSTGVVNSSSSSSSSSSSGETDSDDSNLDTRRNGICTVKDISTSNRSSSAQSDGISRETISLTSHHVQSQDLMPEDLDMDF